MKNLYISFWGGKFSRRSFKLVSLTIVSVMIFTVSGFFIANNALAVHNTITVVYVDDDYDDATCTADGLNWNNNCFNTIQAGIGGVDGGGTVNVAAGTYTENLSINKGVSIIGEEDSVVVGQHIVSVSNILIDNIRFEASAVGGSILKLKSINNFKILNSEFHGTGLNDKQKAIFVDKDILVDGFIVKDSSFENFMIAWYFSKNTGADQTNDNVINVEVENVIFENNDMKGIYLEKLSNAHFKNITIKNNGNSGKNVGNGLGYQHSAGVDINLKAGDYFDIVFEGLYVYDNAFAAQYGGGVLIKARDDGSYSGNPASLNSIIIDGGVFEGNERGLRFGEQGQDNDGPLSIIVKNVKFLGESVNYSGTNSPSAYGSLINETKVEVNAENNYWGSENGPIFNENVVGDIDFAPYYTDEEMTELETSYIVCETGCNFNKIQDAINIASSGDIIEVQAGEYIEVGQIIIDKDLTIIGEDRATTIIKPDHDTTTGSYLTTNGWFYIEPSVSFVLSNVTLDGEGRTIHTAIQSRGELVVKNSVVKNIYSSIYMGIGIQFLAGSNNSISDSELINIQRIGVHVRGNIEPTNPIATISDSVYNGKGIGDFLDYGIEFGGGGSGTVDGFSVSDCVGVASSDGSTSAGIYATDYYGTGTSATIENSVFANNHVGIAIGYSSTDITTLTARKNTFNSNTHGIENVGLTETDAKNNWWGDESGPSGEGSGTGDKVSVNVLFDPWYVDSNMTILANEDVYVDVTGDDSNYGYFSDAPKATIQAGINVVAEEGAIHVAAGTYPETLDLKTKELSILGDSTDTVTLDASSLTGYAVKNFGDNTIIKDIKLIGTSNNYGFKISGVSDIALENIIVENSYHTAIDLNGVNTATLKNITITGTQTKGFGLMIGDSNDITIDNIDTSLATTPWGGVTVQTYGKYYPGGSDNVKFIGSFNSDLMVEQDPLNNVYSEITNLVLPSQFNYATYGERNPGTEGYKQTFYVESLSDANSLALDLKSKSTYIDIAVSDSEKEIYYVNQDLMIQDAINASSSGDTIKVRAGLYEEKILIDKPLTLRGATYNVNKNGYDVPVDYAWDTSVESIIQPPVGDEDETVVTMKNISDIVFEGFIVQALNRSNSGARHLVLASTNNGIIENIDILNNIIGPNTNVISQDGKKGRMNLIFDAGNSGSAVRGIENSLIKGNKIFDAKGNGVNIFVFGLSSSSGNYSSFSGTIIEDNEIYGSHRTGIETAGGIKDLTIRNNKIYNNSGLSGEETDLKYGHGILVIRKSSDRTIGGYSAQNLTIENNEIYDNEKSGIYFGPVNKDYQIKGNNIYDNGWDGIMIDLDGRFCNPDFETCSPPNVTACYNCSENIIVNGNNIYSNKSYGIRVFGTPINGFSVNAEYNYWGDESGPYHNSTNIDATGNEVTDNVDYRPWYNEEDRKSFTLVTTTNPDGNKDATLDNEILLEGDMIKATIPANTDITGGTGWDGTINAPVVKVTATVNPSRSGYSSTVNKVIEIGFSGIKLMFDKAVKIVIPGEAGNLVGYSYDGSNFHKITTVCSANTEAWNTNNLPAGGDCYLNNGGDLIVWTKHFTEYVTYTESKNPVSSGGGGGGGGGRSSAANISGSNTPVSDGEEVIVLGLESDYRTIQLERILDEASYIYLGDAVLTADKVGLVRDANIEATGYDRYVLPLMSGIDDLEQLSIYSLTNFIVYGTETTKILGAGERAGVLSSYKSAFGKLPTTESEWADVIKIANGRWPNERSESAEIMAKEKFEEVYLRLPDMDNPNDNAAVTIMSYGLRPDVRNLDSEKSAIDTFRAIFKYDPSSATDWDIVRAIAYSGSVR